MCLLDLRQGQSARIVHIHDETSRAELNRYGISTGRRMRCRAKLPSGSLVLRYGREEIVLGRDLARKIHVTPVGRFTRRRLHSAERGTL